MPYKTRRKGVKVATATNTSQPAFKFDRNIISLIVLLSVLGVAAYLVVRPYIFVFILSLVFVLVFEPVYLWIFGRVRRSYLASSLTTLLIALIILLPVVFVAIAAITELTALINSWQLNYASSEHTAQELYDNLLNSIPQNLEFLRTFVRTNQDSILTFLISALGNLVGWVGSGVVPVANSGIRFLLNLVIFLTTLVYLFPSKDAFLRELSELNPLEHSKYDKFVRRLVSVVKATMTSLLIIAVAQGLLGWMVYAVVGIRFATLLGVVQALVSFIPIGAVAVWIPVGVGLILSGQWFNGVVVLLWGTLVISTIDNVIRPYILKSGEARVPELVTLFSALGGVVLFGFWGFLFGPLIASSFLTALELYKEHLAERKL